MTAICADAAVVAWARDRCADAALMDAGGDFADAALAAWARDVFGPPEELAVVPQAFALVPYGPITHSAAVSEFAVVARDNAALAVAVPGHLFQMSL